MKIYYSHATQDYNTEYELKYLNIIKEMYPDSEIINPKDILIKETDKEKLSGHDYSKFISMMRKYYFREIKKCDLLIAIPSNKNLKFSQGVLKEIKYAETNNIKVRKFDIPSPSPYGNCSECGKQILLYDSVRPKEDEPLCEDCAFYLEIYGWQFDELKI